MSNNSINHFDLLVQAVNSFVVPQEAIDEAQFSCYVLTKIKSSQKLWLVSWTFCADCDEWHCYRVEEGHLLCLN